MVPSGAAQESAYIKTELQEPHPEEALQEDKAQGAWSWGRLSQGSKEKAPFLPGGGEERGVKRSAFLGSSCEEKWRLAAQVGRGRGPAMVRRDAWMSAHLPLGGHPGTAQSLLTSSWVGSAVGFEAAVGVPGMSPLGEQQDAAG